jgi:glucose/arabinose dehydrogenase
MTRNVHLLWLVAGMAIASVPVAQAAQANTKERKAQTEKIIKNQRSFQQPRTMAEADATQVKMVDGTVKSAVASELWSTLSVREGADGKLEIVETEGMVAPASTGESER